MLSYFVTSITGWLMMILLVIVIVYPWLLRRGWLGLVQPYLKRMRFHYWLGYSIGTVLLVHIWFSMSGGMAGVVNQLGLYLAMAAFFLIVIQIMVGRQLSQATLSNRRFVRRWHFWVMLAIVVFVSTHVALNNTIMAMMRGKFV